MPSRNYLRGIINESLFPCAVNNDFDYVFSENGLVVHKNGKLIGARYIEKCKALLRIMFFIEDVIL